MIEFFKIVFQYLTKIEAEIDKVEAKHNKKSI